MFTLCAPPCLMRVASAPEFARYERVYAPFHECAAQTNVGHHAPVSCCPHMSATRRVRNIRATCGANVASAMPPVENANSAMPPLTCYHDVRYRDAQKRPRDPAPIDASVARCRSSPLFIGCAPLNRLVVDVHSAAFHAKDVFHQYTSRSIA